MKNEGTIMKKNIVRCLVFLLCLFTLSQTNHNVFAAEFNMQQFFASLTMLNETSNNQNNNEVNINVPPVNEQKPVEQETTNAVLAADPLPQEADHFDISKRRLQIKKTEQGNYDTEEFKIDEKHKDAKLFQVVHNEEKHPVGSSDRIARLMVKKNGSYVNIPLGDTKLSDYVGQNLPFILRYSEEPKKLDFEYHYHLRAELPKGTAATQNVKPASAKEIEDSGISLMCFPWEKWPPQEPNGETWRVDFVAYYGDPDPEPEPPVCPPCTCETICEECEKCDDKDCDACKECEKCKPCPEPGECPKPEPCPEPEKCPTCEECEKCPTCEECKDCDCKEKECPECPTCPPAEITPAEGDTSTSTECKDGSGCTNNNTNTNGNNSNTNGQNITINNGSGGNGTNGGSSTNGSAANPKGATATNVGSGGLPTTGNQAAYAVGLLSMASACVGILIRRFNKGLF